MIEFKGECGHLIRARSEDIGKVVRCSYCGAEAVVARPVADDDPAADLFDAVEQTGEFDATATKAMRQSHKQRKRAEKRVAAGKSATLDPFAVILRMTYVAVVIVIAAVAWKYVPNLYRQLSGQSGKSTQETTEVAHVATPAPVATAQPRVNSQRAQGLLTAKLDIHPDGAYVTSVPTGATVFEMAGWGLADKIFSQEKDRFEARGTALVKLKPGKHTIAVAALISDPALMRMTGYVDLRAALEASQSDQEASRRLKEYLLPDDDAAERLVRIGRYRYIARIYEVEVDNSWVAVTALFLPRRPLTELMGYLPQQKTYGFNASDVRRELAFYKVPERDRADLLDALGRVGRMSYRNSDDEPYRLFQIDPNDGRIASERLDY